MTIGTQLICLIKSKSAAPLLKNYSSHHVDKRSTY